MAWVRSALGKCTWLVLGATMVLALHACDESDPEGSSNDAGSNDASSNETGSNEANSDEGGDPANMLCGEVVESMPECGAISTRISKAETEANTCLTDDGCAAGSDPFDTLEGVPCVIGVSKTGDYSEYDCLVDNYKQRCDWGTHCDGGGMKPAPFCSEGRCAVKDVSCNAVGCDAGYCCDWMLAECVEADADAGDDAGCP